MTQVVIVSLFLSLGLHTLSTRKAVIDLAVYWACAVKKKLNCICLFVCFSVLVHASRSLWQTVGDKEQSGQSRTSWTGSATYAVTCTTHSPLYKNTLYHVLLLLLTVPM